VKSKGPRGATGAEIVKHWKLAGAWAGAYVDIGELVKAKRLKREPLKEERGSRYTLA